MKNTKSPIKHNPLRTLGQSLEEHRQGLTDESDSVSTTGLVVDKSYLQGTSTSKLVELGTRYSILIPDATYYELLSTSETSRAACFSKLRMVNKSLKLLKGIPEILRYEFESCTPALQTNRFDRFSGQPWQFDSTLCDPDHVYADDIRESLHETSVDIREEVAGYVQQIECIPDFFPALAIGSDESRKSAQLDAEQDIVSKDGMKFIYNNLRETMPYSCPPTYEMLDCRWCAFWWLRIKCLFALEAYRRYPNGIDLRSTGTYDKLEHDIMDMHVVISGCLEGTLATREKKHHKLCQLVATECQLIC